MSRFGYVVAVLVWRRDARGVLGLFGAVFSLDDVSDFIASQPASWIRV